MQIQIFTCNVCTIVVCKVPWCVQIMTAFCVFHSNFCQWLCVCVCLCAFFFIFVLMVVVFSIRLWPIAKFVFWNCLCGAYCVTCDSNQNGTERNSFETLLIHAYTHTYTLWQKHMPFIIFQFCYSIFSLQLYLTTNQSCDPAASVLVRSIDKVSLLNSSVCIKSWLFILIEFINLPIESLCLSVSTGMIKSMHQNIYGHIFEPKLWSVHVCLYLYLYMYLYFYLCVSIYLLILNDNKLVLSTHSKGIELIKW